NLFAPDGTPLGPDTEFPALSHDGAEAMRLLIQARCAGYPTALIGALFDGQAIARFLAHLTGAPLTAHSLIKDSRLEDVIGTSHHPGTLSHSSLIATMREGGIFLVNAPEPSTHYLDLMRGIAQFVQRLEPGIAAGPAQPPAGLPDGFRIHDDFALVFNFPRGA